MVGGPCYVSRFVCCYKSVVLCLYVWFAESLVRPLIVGTLFRASRLLTVHLTSGLLRSNRCW